MCPNFIGILFNSHNALQSGELLIAPYYSAEPKGSEKISNLPKITQLEGADPETVRNSPLDCKALCLVTTPNFLF